MRRRLSRDLERAFEDTAWHVEKVRALAKEQPGQAMMHARYIAYEAANLVAELQRRVDRMNRQ